MTTISKLEILREAREIAYKQGAVKNAVRFWEDRDTDEGVETSGDTDPGLCRVCVAGAIYLAEFRMGLKPRSGKAPSYLDVARFATARYGDDWLNRLDGGNTEFLIEVLDALIEEHVAREVIAEPARELAVA